MIAGEGRVYPQPLGIVTPLTSSDSRAEMDRCTLILEDCIVVLLDLGVCCKIQCSRERKTSW